MNMIIKSINKYSNKSINKYSNKNINKCTNEIIDLQIKISTFKNI